MSDVAIIISTNANQVSKEIKGLAGDVVGAAAQAKALTNAMEFLDNAFNKGRISGDQYSAAIQKLDKAEDNLYGSLLNANAAIKKQETVVKSTAAATSKAAISAQALTKAQRMSGKSTNRFGMLAQQVGYQVGDFNVQVQSGANALVAFGQQGTQLAGLLPGLGGAILGIGLSLVTAALRSKEQAEGLAFSFTAMKKDILDSLSTIKPLLDGIAKTIAAIADIAIKFGKVLVENLDRVATYVLVAAAAFSGKFVAGLIAARVATFSLAGAFAFLRKAIIRTGIGAIIVLVAEAVLMFGKLSKAVGGVGPLLELLKDAFFEIINKISGRLQWLSEMNKAAFYQIVLNVLQALRDLLSKVNSDFVNKFIGYFAGAIAGAVEYIKTLPSVFVEVFKSIKMAVIKGVNAFTGVIGKGINYLRGKLRMEKIDFGDLIDISGMSEGNVTGVINEAVGKIGAAVKTAVEKDYVGAIESGLTNTINETNKSMQKALKEAVSLDAGLKKPTTAVEKLKEAFAGLKDETSSIDVTSWFTGKKDKDGKDGKSLTDALTEAQQKVQDVADTIKSSMSNGFMAMVEGTKTVKDAFKDMAREIIKKLYEILVVQQIVGSYDAKSGIGSGIVGAIFGAFSGSAAPATSPRPKIRPFADGGIVGGPTVFPMAGGKAGLMGEAGPEAIMPLKRGANGKLGVQAEGGGSTTVVQNFNFQANGDDSVKRIIAQAAPQIANMTKKSMLDDRRRGGQMKATFG